MAQRFPVTVQGMLSQVLAKERALITEQKRITTHS